MVELPAASSRPRLIHLAGIPASGKSSLGRYLAQEHGVLHVDAEEPGELAVHGLQAAWDALFTTRSARELVRAATATGSPCMLDWGFPVSCLPFVAAMKAAGFEIWWCDGDREAAHRLYRARPVKNSEAAWLAQMAGIQGRWPEIFQLVGDQILQTVHAGPAIRPLPESAAALGFQPSN